MTKVALLLAPGFEEIEALTVVDVLRRAAITCEMLGFEQTVTGSHGITVQADALWDGSLEGCDMVVLPGGMPGSAHLRDDQRLMDALVKMNKENKWIAAICAAPIALENAGVLKGKNFTCYDGAKQGIFSGNYQKETVVIDGNIITSRSAATALPFAYALVEQLGGDAKTISDAMLYADVFGK